MRGLEVDSRLPPEVLAMRQADDVGPFLPLLRRELLAVGFAAVDWASEGETLRGWYVVALRRPGDEDVASGVWLRYRARLTEDLIELAWSVPRDPLSAVVTISADAPFIATALLGRQRALELVLDRADAEFFVAALLRPAKPTPELVRLFARQRRPKP